MNKILIANRGEIALRIIRTAKEMGIQTVAIYSEVDRLAPHVCFADEAICIGPAPSSQSYLLGDKIIEEAKKLNVDGIHPGYGFLSENASFAEAVTKAKMTFIGPSADSINTMGNKLLAKKAVMDYNIPLVPGTEEALKDIEEAIRVSKEIGFPILIKAAAGGGGKGMRIVKEEKDLEEQVQMAIGEAKSAFGDGRVFIEKYLESPRHIEVQVLADNHGNTVHLFERECSIQRRHQKLIEEAPSVIVDKDLREELGKCAVQVAKACNYSGAGTVEFIMDTDKRFYFLEMNTRLQVEHPVTELITGIDLVREQIEVARNKKLGFKQEDLSINGHAIELRVCAEDPNNNFLPDIGKLKVYNRPHGPGIRVDDSMYPGMDIPIYYDPMLAKLIVYAENRNTAIDRMLRAIEEYNIQGVKTTLPFGTFALKHDAFISGNFDTHFIDKYFSSLDNNNIDEEESKIAALAALLFARESKNLDEVTEKNINTNSSWYKSRKQ